MMPHTRIDCRGVAEFRKGVTNVKFHERAAVSISAILTWEKMHYPYLLPEDYKRFISISDGLLLRWDFLFQGRHRTRDRA